MYRSTGAIALVLYAMLNHAIQIVFLGLAVLVLFGGQADLFIHGPARVLAGTFICGFCM